MYMGNSSYRIVPWFLVEIGFECLIERENEITVRAESTHCWGKYHCTASLQVYKFGFNCFTTHKNNIFSLLVKSSLVKLETSCTVILPPMVSVLWWERECVCVCFECFGVESGRCVRNKISLCKYLISFGFPSLFFTREKKENYFLKTAQNGLFLFIFVSSTCHNLNSKNNYFWTSSWRFHCSLMLEDFAYKSIGEMLSIKIIIIHRTCE